MQVGRHAGSEGTRPAIHTLATARCSMRRAFAERQASDHAWRGYLLDLSPPLAAIILSMLRHPVLPLHAEEVARARQHLMQDSHDTSEHLRCDILIDLRIIFEG